MKSADETIQTEAIKTECLHYTTCSCFVFSKQCCKRLNQRNKSFDNLTMLYKLHVAHVARNEITCFALKTALLLTRLNVKG
jgi:hypothetical protein